MQTYLFYDIETTGLSKSFDQVLHFAAIRTDLTLTELNRYDLKIKLNPDVTPTPQALTTHKMGIKEISSGISEYQAIKQIHQWLNEPGTISVGYNTLGFDDEFLRFSFYRNLLKPYTHQYANQCSRMDIYPMTVMFLLFKNHVINWPQRDGRNSLKLEDLNSANQFISGRSHHAMIDVEITLELARRLMQEQEMWDYLNGSFNKQIDTTRTQSVQNDMALIVTGKLGAKYNYQCPALFLGQHQYYKNQSVWLRLDEENMIETSRAINKKFGEPNFVLPFKERFLQQLSQDRLDLAKKNQQWLQQHPEEFTKITKQHTHFQYPVYPQTDVQAGLYINGFWSSEEETFCQKFHAANPAQQAKMIDHVNNPRLRTLALRILGREHPEALTAEQAKQFEEYMQNVRTTDENRILIDFKGSKRLTPKVALSEIEELRKKPENHPEDLLLLDELEDYLRG